MKAFAPMSRLEFLSDSPLRNRLSAPLPFQSFARTPAGHATGALRGPWLARLVFALLLLQAAGAGRAADPAPAPAAPTNAVRPVLAKILAPAQEMLRNKQFKEAVTALQPADAVPDRTPYEIFITRRMQGVALAGAGDLAGASKMQELVIADPLLAPEDRLAIEKVMAQDWYDKPPLTESVKWGERYLKDGGKEDVVHIMIAQSLYKAGDYKGTIDAIHRAISAEPGTQPTEPRLQMLASAESKIKDDEAYIATLEQLVTLYPKKDYWNNLLANLERKPGFEEYMVLDVFRLRLATGSMKEAEDFTDMAQLSLHAGYPAEARRALDAGVAAGLLGPGKGGPDYAKLRQQADNQSDEDRKLLGQGDAKAEAAKDGVALYAAGFNYVTFERFDKGLPMMVKGFSRGGFKRPEVARLQLGESYALAGQKAEAASTLAAVKGTDGSADLARLWGLYLKALP